MARSKHACLGICFAFNVFCDRIFFSPSQFLAYFNCFLQRITLKIFTGNKLPKQTELSKIVKVLKKVKFFCMKKNASQKK